MLSGIIIGSISVSSLIIASIALAFAVFNFIELRAMKQSTHTIQYMPADQLPGGERLDDDLTIEGLKSSRDIQTEPDPFEAL